MDAAVRPRSGIPVPNSRMSQRPAVSKKEDGHTQATKQNDTDLCTETVSVKTAVHMFGGEAKIRKLPTPDRSLKRNTNKPLQNSKKRDEDVKESVIETNIDEEIRLDFGTTTNDIMDYPIRGTISPLTDSNSYGKAAVNGLSCNSISFVFGRPSEPVGDSEAERCKSPPSNDRRPLSPTANATPVKRRGMYAKPPIYVPPNSKGVEKPQGGVSDRKISRKMYALGEISHSSGIHCEQCNNCLIDLKRQTLRLVYPDGAYGGSVVKTPNAVEKIEGKLQVPGQCQKLLKNDHCDVCDTHVQQLKKEALAAVLSLQQTQTELPLSPQGQLTPGVTSIRPQGQLTPGVTNIRPSQQRAASNTSNGHARPPRSNRGTGQVTSPGQITTQVQVHVDQNNRTWNGQKLYNQMISQQRSGTHGPGESRPFSPEMSGVGPYGGVQASPYHMQYGSEIYNMQSTGAYNVQTGSGFISIPPGANPYMLQSGSGNMPTVSGSYMPHSGSGIIMPHGSVQYVPQSGLGPHYYTPQGHRPNHVITGSNYSNSQYVNYSVPPPTQSPPPPPPMSPPAFSRVSSPGSTSSQQSAAASFFARAAQKLGKKKKRHHQQEPELPQYPTRFHLIIRTSPPPAPPCLLRTVGRVGQPGVGKVKVMLKICSSTSGGEQGQSCLSIDPRKKQVTVFDPSSIGIPTSAHRRTTPTAPKMFAFDSVFSPDDSQTEICASSLTEIIQGVVNGADGCLFTYGYSKLGKTYTMIGKDASSQTLGIMPCAIAWLFRLINEQKEKTGARFSVRVSAVEVCGKSEHLRDLLSDVALGTESGIGTAPGVYLRDDPICGTQLENQSELRAPSADRAAYYLDAALAARSHDEEEGRSSHLLFTLHVYQYRIEKANQAGLPGVAGGRSRLHLIDLGSSSKSKDPENVSLSLSALGNVIMALLNGQRHVPHRDSKVAQLLRDSLGNISCRTCMLAHVSSAVTHHNETLQVIQLAARIHRMRRRKTKFSSTSSDDSSTDDGRLRRPFRGFRMGTLREDTLYSSSHSDPDYTSSSEQSCDTVIYVGANGQSLSDREITDNEGPPRSVPRTNPRLPRRPSGSKSSGDEGSNSDSGRSRASSDFRYGRAALVNRPSFNVNRSLSPKVQQSVRDVSVVGPHPQSPPMSPGVGAVHLPRKVHVRTRPAVNKPEESQHPLDKVQRSGIKGHMDQKVIKGEQWIDGPGANVLPDKKKLVEEHWIDGPQAFVVKQEQHVSKNDAVNKHLFNPKMNAEEQWVDGPREMIAGSPAHKEGKTSHNKATVHTSCRNERGSHSQESKASPSHSAKHSKSKQHSLDVKSMKERPDSTVSADSATSITAQGPDSRPVSVHVDGEKTCKPEEGSQIINPFVRDWVEKHSNVPEVENSSTVGFNIVDCENQVIGTLESASKHKRPKPESRRKLSASTPKHSPHHSPRNSPSVARKGKCEGGGTLKLQKSHLPMPANPTHRVAEWLKSVSMEQSKEGQKDGCDSSGPPGGAQCPSVNVNSSSQDVSSCSSVQMDTTAEMDSQCDTTINTAHCSSDGRPDEMAECNIGDISFDSSVDTTEFNTLLSSNRESIYEIQMDEQLEKTGDSKSVDIPDNDTFSSASCNKDNDDLSDGECNYDGQEDEPLMAKDSRVPRSLTVESIKTLLAEPLEQINAKEQEQTSVNQNQSCKLCDKDSLSSKLYESEKSESQDMIKTSLLRKPDGASNPNLINELNFEGKFDVNFIRGEYVINNVHALSSHPNVDLNSYKNSTSVLESLPKYSDSSERDNSDGKLSSPKSKPPLPSRPSSKSHSASPSRQSSSKIKDKDTSLSPKSTSSYSSKISSASPSPSHTSRTKDKNRIPSTSSMSSQRSSSLPISGSPSSTCTTRSTSSKSSKTQSPSSSRLPVFTSKTLQCAKDSKARKKEKDVKLGNGRVGELNRTSSRGTDSDSGNDSGIVTNEKKLLSPYSTITKPRTPSHSSSGHGSDNSSTVSADLRSQLGIKSDKIHGGTSSGYESMLRDSEGTASSSGQEESNSESSSDKKKGSKRKRSSTKRSRSAPARSSESPDRKSPSSNGKPTSPSPKAWVDTRQIQKIKEEPFEIKLYDMDDVERLGRRRGDDEIVMSDMDQRKEKIKEMLAKQGKQPELIESKDQIVMENRNWGFDCKLLMCFCRSKPKKTDV